MTAVRRWLAALCIALTAGLAAPAAAAVTDPAVAEEVARLNASARAAISGGDFATALAAYRRAAAVLAGDEAATEERSRALFLAAVCLERLERPAEAIAMHREALDAGLGEALAAKSQARIAKLEAAVGPPEPAPEATAATDAPPSAAPPAEVTATPSPAAAPAADRPAGSGAGVAAVDPPMPTPAAEPAGQPDAPTIAAVEPPEPAETPAEDAPPAVADAEPAKAPDATPAAEGSADVTPADAPPVDDTAARLAELDGQAKAAVKDGEWETAATAYRQAAELLATLPERRAEQATTWFLVGFCLDRLERRTEAELAYEQARLLGPPDSVLRRIEARMGAPLPDTAVPVELVCAPTDLSVSVAGVIDHGPCGALRQLPPGVWRIEARGADGRRATRTVHVVPETGRHRFSLVAPPSIEPLPPVSDYRQAWVLTLAAAVTVAAGGTLLAVDSPDEPAPELAPVGTGLVAAGGVLTAVALYSWLQPTRRARTRSAMGLGPAGFTF